MLFSVLQQDRTTLFHLRFLGLAPFVALFLILVGIHSLSLAARYRVAACSTTLTQRLEKVSAARGHTCTPLFAPSKARIPGADDNSTCGAELSY